MEQSAGTAPLTTSAPRDLDPESGANGATGMGVAGRLGHLLVERRLVSPAQVDEALQLQQEGSTQRLGEILVAIGAVGERELVHPLAELFDMPVSDLRSESPDPAAL